MKKFALATIFALATTSAFAGFNGGNTQGGFQQATPSAISVKQALDNEAFEKADLEVLRIEKVK